ncbi:MAG: GerMN domain-containing protein [Ilumatobacteraceae bacterium]
MRVSRISVIFLLALLTSCGVPMDDGPSALTPVVDSQPSTTTTPDNPANFPNRLDQVVVVYLIRGEGLVGETTFVRTGFDINDLLNALISGPSATFIDLGARSGLTQRVDLVKSVEIVDGFADVSLSGSFNDLPGNEQTLIVGQLTLTFVANLPINGVIFKQDGQVVAVPDADGTPIIEPASRINYVTLLTRP